MNSSDITALSCWAEAWLASLFRACGQGGLWILAVWLICRMARRLPAAARVWLWWFACLKLILGLVPLAPLTLPLLPARPPSVVPLPQPSKGSSGLTPRIDARPLLAKRVYGKEALTSRPPGLREADQTRFRSPSISEGQGGARKLERQGVSSKQAAFALLLMALWTLMLVWRLTGVVRQMARCGALARQAEPITDAAVLAAAREIGRALNLRRLPDLRTSEAIAEPMIVGLPRPVVLLPRAFLAPPSLPSLRMILAHELTHLRRGDLRLMLLPTLAQTLFGFFPPAWLAVREYRIACEAACDAETLRITGAEAREYGLLLLSFASHSHRAGAMALGSSFGYHSLERRLKMLPLSAPVLHRPLRRNMACLFGLSVACLLPWHLGSMRAIPARAQASASLIWMPTLAQRSTQTAERRQAGSAGHAAAEPLPLILQGTLLDVHSASPAGPATSLPAFDVRLSQKQPDSLAASTPPAGNGGHGLPTGRLVAARVSFPTGEGGDATPVTREAGKILLDLGETNIYEALKALFRQTKVSYRIDAEAEKIAAATPVTISIINAPFPTALNMIVDASSKEAPLTYRFENGFYLIVAVHPPEKAATAVTTQSKIPVLGELPIIGNMFTKPAPRTMSTTLAQVYASSVSRNSDPKVTFTPTQIPHGSAIARSAPTRIEEVLHTSLSFKADHVPLRRALQLLFEQTGVNYALDPTVGEENVIASLKEVPFQVVLETLLRQSRSPLTYRVANNVIQVLLRSDSAY